MSIKTTFFIKHTLYLITLIAVMSCKKDQKQSEKIAVNYPKTQQVDTVTNYFGTTVKDPYRWLEDDRSKDTENWVKAQNKATFGYLDHIPYRKALKDRLTELWNYEKVSAPFKEGDYTYFYKNDGLQNQSVIYRYKTGANPQTAKVFIDPNTFKEDGTISLGGASFSKNGKILAQPLHSGAAVFGLRRCLYSQLRQSLKHVDQD